MSAISATVQMYGGLWCFRDSEFDNKYYLTAKQKPSPIDNAFDRAYFNSLFDKQTVNLSLKAFLATEQRIPGLGNGVLQDILWNAYLHPKRKISTLADSEKEALFNAIKSTLGDMTRFGGRDTEQDLFGNSGGYKTILSKNNLGMPCPACGGMIKKENYMGGSIYFCGGCQKV